MASSLMRSALRARVAMLRKSGLTGSEVQAVAVRCMASGPRSGSRNSNPRKPRGDEDDLYDPYTLYEEQHGKKGYRDFNPELMDDVDNFEWEEPEELMADKSWPQTSGTDMFEDLFNVSGEPPAPEKLDLILKEFYRRVQHKPINEMQLPEMSVQVPEDDPEKEALEIMKLSLMNNGRILMDDKDQIMAGIIDEIDHVRKDTTTLFKDIELDEE